MDYIVSNFRWRWEKFPLSGVSHFPPIHNSGIEALRLSFSYTQQQKLLCHQRCYNANSKQCNIFGDKNIRLKFIEAFCRAKKATFTRKKF